MSTKNSSSRRWFNILVPTFVLGAGIVLLGQQALKGSTVTTAPNGPARVSYELPTPVNVSKGDGARTVDIDNWQATAGCHKT